MQMDNKIVNVKKIVRNGKNDGPVGKLGCVLVWRGRVVGGGGYAIPQYLQYKKYDIS